VAAGKGLALESVQPGAPLEVYCDPADLDRIAVNLVGNAIKYTARGHVRVSLAGADDRVRLEVADTGIGIPRDKLARIFERFYQVDGSATRQYGGVGVGLALVKEIVEAHGGRICVTSQVGAGTTFTIQFPAHSI
jgi:signal transduction histidine kinase